MLRITLEGECIIKSIDELKATLMEDWFSLIICSSLRQHAVIVKSYAQDFLFF